MPYPRHFTWQRWEECPRCGLDWPKDQLKREYTGAKVCPECFDQKGYEEALDDVMRRLEEDQKDEDAMDVL